MAAAAALGWYEERAKGRQQQSPGRPKKGVENLPPSANPEPDAASRDYGSCDALAFTNPAGTTIKPGTYAAFRMKSA